MRKVRRNTYILIAILIILVSVGAFFAFMTPNRITEISFNIIALVVSTISVSLAILSQLSTERSRKIDERVMRDLREIDRNVEDDAAVDRSLRYKLDKIIAQNEIIYVKMGGNLEDFNEKTADFAREKQLEQRRKEKKASKSPNLDKI